VKNKVLLALGIGAAIIGLTVFLSMTGWYDGAVAAENGVKAQWKSNQNTYDAFWKKVQEVAQVPSQYKDDFKELLVAETQAKFGAEGSKATFQWFKDRNINFDASLYRKVQDVIESGRDDFKRSQDMLTDRQRVYTNKVEGWWGGILASHYGFPREVKGDVAPPKDLDGDGKLTVLDYPIVTSARTKKAFQTGEDEQIDVFGKKK